MLFKLNIQLFLHRIYFAFMLLIHSKWSGSNFGNKVAVVKKSRSEDYCTERQPNLIGWNAFVMRRNSCINTGVSKVRCKDSVMWWWEACGVPEQCPQQSDWELWGMVSWGTVSRPLYSVFICKWEHCSECRAGLLLNGIRSGTMVTTIELFEMCHFRGLKEIPVGLLGSAITKEFFTGMSTGVIYTTADC